VDHEVEEQRVEGLLQDRAWEQTEGLDGSGSTEQRRDQGDEERGVLRVTELHRIPGNQASEEQMQRSSRVGHEPRRQGQVIFPADLVEQDDQVTRERGAQEEPVDRPHGGLRQERCTKDREQREDRVHQKIIRMIPEEVGEVFHRGLRIASAERVRIGPEESKIRGRCHDQSGATVGAW
jgi:hypothetical protein